MNYRFKGTRMFSSLLLIGVVTFVIFCVAVIILNKPKPIPSVNPTTTTTTTTVQTNPTRSVTVTSATTQTTNFVTTKTQHKTTTVTHSRTTHPSIGKPTEIDKKMFSELQKKYDLVYVPTYEGSNQLTHPKALYFPDGWHGHRYWMSMTPYPWGRDYNENPSVVVSDDGNTWKVPDGLSNPVTGFPPDVKEGGHYSDPQLIMRGNAMELWYRYNPALPNQEKKRLPDNKKNIYLMQTTTDGIHWTRAQEMFENNDGAMSLCGFYENNVYKTWYSSYSGFLNYSESADGKNWSHPVNCAVPLPEGFRSYHQDIIHYGSKYYLLMTGRKSTATFKLFLLQSEDGIHFTDTKQVFPSGDMELWKDVMFYRSTLFVKDGKLDLYISVILPSWQWYLAKTELPLNYIDIPTQSVSPSQSTTSAVDGQTTGNRSVESNPTESKPTENKHPAASSLKI